MFCQLIYDKIICWPERRYNVTQCSTHWEFIGLCRLLLLAIPCPDGISENIDWVDWWLSLYSDFNWYKAYAQACVRRSDWQRNIDVRLCSLVRRRLVDAIPKLAFACHKVINNFIKICISYLCGCWRLHSNLPICLCRLVHKKTSESSFPEENLMFSVRTGSREGIEMHTFK